MSWAEVSIFFLVCHLVGDYLVQTDWQATHKYGGLGRDSTARRALLSHILTYTLAFVPALIWIGDAQGAVIAVGAAALISVPHLVIDDGRLLLAYMREIKGMREAPRAAVTTVVVGVDQSVHIVSLWAVALLIAA